MARQKNSEIDAQLRALTVPAGTMEGVYNEWEGLPFVELVPGYLVLRQHLNDASPSTKAREPIAYDLEGFYQSINGSRNWSWRIEDGRFIATIGNCNQ